MQKTLLFFISFIISMSIDAQKHDHRWMMGYGDSTQDPSFGTSHINFNYDPASIYLEDTELNFNGCNVCMSTLDGELLFYSNCIDLYNFADEKMSNSEDFNYSEIHEGYSEFGLPLIQGTVSLQSVIDENIYHLFHLKLDYEFIDQDNFYFYTKGLYYSTIDMTGDNGKGAMVEKGVPIIEDTLAVGGLSATRHANGRDWWLLMPEHDSNTYYRILLNAQGVQLVENQTVGSPTISGLGQACFSPDGNWYVRHNMLGGPEGDDFLDIYRFDRCTGLLSNHQRFAYGYGVNAGGGAVISPDSRFLYVGHRNHVYQLDLEAVNIQETIDTIAVYDGFVEAGFLKPTFFLGQNAPDGKIYFNCTNGASFMHLIHNPNGEGVACRFEQRGVDLPTYNSSSLPNFPNYRLGPKDGSPCDTLGINNIPLATFNYYSDSSDYLSINFWDYSFYEPTDWEWTFGDSGQGEGQTPVHTYAAPGIYEVCLTASNDYGSDSICKLLELSPVGIREILPEKEKVVLFPNPVIDKLTLSFAKPLAADAIFHLFNALGQKVRSFPISRGQRNYSLSMSKEQRGIYFYSIEIGSRIFDSGKLIVQRE